MDRGSAAVAGGLGVGGLAINCFGGGGGVVIKTMMMKWAREVSGGNLLHPDTFSDFLEPRPCFSRKFSTNFRNSQRLGKKKVGRVEQSKRLEAPELPQRGNPYEISLSRPHSAFFGPKFFVPNDDYYRRSPPQLSLPPLG